MAGHRIAYRIAYLVAYLGAYLVAGTALAAVQILRRPAVLDRVWAEDGAIFGADAFTHHVWQSVGRGYSGYLVALPRLLAAPVVSLVPPSSWGRWFAWSSVAVAAFAALAVFRASWPLVRSPWLRVALAITLALGPKMRGEWPAVANVAWPLLMALLWMIVSTRTDAVTVVTRITVVLAALVSSAVGLLFAPCVAVVVWVRRGAPGDVRRADRLVAGAFALGAVAQLAGMATAPAGPPREASTVPEIVRLVAVRVFGTVVVGDRFLDDLWFDVGDVLGAVAVVVVLGGALLLARRCPREARVHAALALGTALVTVVLSLRIRGTARIAITDGRFVFDADRYFLIPCFLVISALIILFDAASLPRAVAPAVLAHLGLVVVATGLTLPPPGERGPSWGPELRGAVETCRSDPSPDRLVSVPVAPAPPFQMTVPCSRIEGA